MNYLLVGCTSITNPAPRSAKSNESIFAEEETSAKHGRVRSTSVTLDEPNSPNPRRLRWLRQVTITVISFIFGSVISVLAAKLVSSGGYLNSGYQEAMNSDCACGNSVAEAHVLGCKFDVLAMAWLPLECRDDALTNAFRRAGPGSNGSWSYFADENKETALDEIQLSLLADTDDVFYTTRRWHLMHCNFYWLKLFRSRATGIKMEAIKNRQEHISHCGNMALKGDSKHLDDITTRSIVRLNSGLL
jgi:hypothetical protein